jgi:amino acid transporter
MVSRHPGNTEALMGTRRRELGLVEVAALSLAIMAPTAAMALNGSLAASIAGTAVPLSFLFALVTIAFVAYAFVEFARQYSTAGSVYTFNGVALGARAGFLSGWALLLTYVAFTAASAAETGAFFESFAGVLGLHVSWFVPALVAAVLVWLLGTRDVSLSTRATLVIEALSIVVIIVLAVVILARGGAHGLTLQPLAVGSGGVGAVGLASVFAFLSFAGFEGAATLGEETRNPKRAIPRAIVAAVLAAGIFYLVITYVQSIGFGMSASGVHRFATSSSPLGDLAQQYVGAPMAGAIMAGATVSAFACTVAGATAASRLLLTLGRDGLLPSALARVSRTHRSPVTAITVVMIITVIALVGFWAAGAPGSAVFGYLGTIGVLSLLLVYLVTQVGAIVLFGRSGRWHGLQFAVPIIAILLLAYALYANVFPVPAAPYNLFPYIVVVWIVIGVVLAAARPAAMRKVAADLVGHLEQARDGKADEAIESEPIR